MVALNGHKATGSLYEYIQSSYNYLYIHIYTHIWIYVGLISYLLKYNLEVIRKIQRCGIAKLKKIIENKI